MCALPKCEVVGSEIEDTNRGGQNFVKLGVDVQCLGSCCVSQFVCHKILLGLSFKDQILKTMPHVPGRFSIWMAFSFQSRPGKQWCNGQGILGKMNR